MNSIVKPYLLRASLLAGLAILMGLALSILVYLSTEQVRHNAIDLVNNRIPVLTSVNQIIADLSEQERIIYEYYRSQDSQSFLENFAKKMPEVVAKMRQILDRHPKALIKPNRVN